jgi:hypothetical protein
VLNNLLEDDDEAAGKFSVFFGVFFDFFKIEIEGGCHNAGLSVAQSLFEFVLELGYITAGGHFDFLQHKNSFLPDKIRSMGEQLDDMLADSGSNGGVHDVAKRGEANDDFVYVSVGQILDDGGDEHDEHVGVVVEEEGAEEVADPFEDEVLVLGEVDCVDVGEGGGVAQHLDVEGADEVLLDLFGRQLLLPQLRLQG